MSLNEKKREESKLYHYTKMDTLINYILKENKLRAGKLIESNDPKERSSMNFFVSTGLSDITKRNEVLNNFYNHEQKEISKTIKNYSKIICFSVDSNSPKSKGYNHPRMWAQYAENNMGVCLVIDKEKFQKRFEKKFESYKTYCGEVKYNFRKNCEYTKAYTHSIKSNYSIKEISNKKMDKYYNQYFFRKHYDWSHENEFRYVINSNEEEFFYISIEDSLERIILGYNVEEKKKEELKKLLDESKSEIEIYEYSLSYGYYNINEYKF